MATRCWGLLAGFILVVMASCADDNGSRGAAPATAVATDVVLTVPATSSAEGTITATTTSTIDASTIVELDATSRVLAAAVLWRATTGNSWDDPTGSTPSTSSDVSDMPTPTGSSTSAPDEP